MKKPQLVVYPVEYGEFRGKQVKIMSCHITEAPYYFNEPVAYSSIRQSSCWATIIVDLKVYFYYFTRIWPSLMLSNKPAAERPLILKTCL